MYKPFALLFENADVFEYTQKRMQNSRYSLQFPSCKNACVPTNNSLLGHVYCLIEC